MALRPSKITSEILQTCNKFFSSGGADLKSKLPAAAHKDAQAQPALRYKITNTGKPQGMPDLAFKEEPTTLFAELQPSAEPEFRFDFNPPKWAHKATDNSPFPASIKPKVRLHVTYSDQQKADDKMLKYKMACFNQNSTRNYSTGMGPQRHYSAKGPAENSGAGSCKRKPHKCYKAKHKNCALANKDCPRFKLLECEQSKGSNCKLNYLDPNCAKKFAPYPSYSESCAENLPDDPSECQQCPWRTCDGADTIEPGKPVRNKRNFSTSSQRHLETTTGVVTGPYGPPLLLLSKEDCGQSKRPCKQPPGPCEVRRQKEEERRKEREIHVPPRPKKAAERLVLDALWPELEGLGLAKKHPNCHRPKKPKRPDDSKIDEDLSIEYGNAEWWHGRGKKPVVYQGDADDCPCQPCRDVTIRSKQAPLLLHDDKGKQIKGDEGHPPPCDDTRQDSLNCPEKPIKKPKYKKRPMDRGYYKRPEDPYGPSNGGK